MVNTFIYLVRHAESVFIEGKERSRGLTEQGSNDSLIVKNLLVNEQIDSFVSSPYRRAIDTIRPSTIEYQGNIRIEEDLRERTIGDFTPLSFVEAKRKVYGNIRFQFPGGESSVDAQNRAIRVIKELIRNNEGKKLVIGTHGDIMTLIINYYDNRYGFDFWQSTTMPDIYRLEFNHQQFSVVGRLW